MATANTPAPQSFTLSLGSIHVSDAAPYLRALLYGRKESIRQLARSKSREDYNALEVVENRIDGLSWDVEKRLLDLRTMSPRTDITPTFDEAILERLIDERNDNDIRIWKADPSDDYAVWLAKDDAINSELETLLLAAITELQHYQ
ncbi:hypothetical protein J2I47_14985 [Fibrella sp. HMF5335]|uniref:Uncharacterized protein n=1 Tax=Fibrella rubiginis TaxID=2817060 RepID=A0A939GGE1_9BACT|nr:hypothetical protein [Fibrella rubiginis]MBO0937861.1 hypothetical protein [Fibrella rubiginis]